MSLNKRQILRFMGEIVLDVSLSYALVVIVFVAVAYLT